MVAGLLSAKGAGRVESANLWALSWSLINDHRASPGEVALAARALAA